MARLLRLLAAIPLLSLTVMPALASGRYQVQPRDSFYSIARKCRVDVGELMRLNPRPSNALKLGEQLRLPNNAQCGSGAGAAATNLAYQVQLRDSFYSVARKCRVDVGELMRLNPRLNNALKLGEQLRLPGNVQCGSGAGAAATNLAYQVQPREGFYTIARKCQVDAKELMRLNSASGLSLQPGQQLTLPGNARCPARSTTVASTGTPRPTHTAATTRSTPARATGGVTFSYQVQAHEGFYSIAQKCQVDTRELIDLNPDSPTVLRAGQQLTLPGHARCPEPSTAEPSTTVARAAGTKSYYEVQPREGFSSIARKCRVDAKALMALNPRPNNNILHVGEQLELPGGARCESVVAANPAAAANSAATSAADSSGTDPGWRSYGPLKVNWQDWQMIEGHWVAKSMKNSGEPLYVAVNCPAQRINRTGSNGQWSTWDVPDPGFEEKLMNDLCQEKTAQG